MQTFVNFEYQQIKELTNNFDSEIRCGKGKYASVYRVVNGIRTMSQSRFTNLRTKTTQRFV